MKLLNLRLLAAGALLISPYVPVALFLAINKSFYACAGYALAVFSGMLMLAFVGKTVRRTYLLYLPVFFFSLVFAAYTMRFGDMPGYPIAYVLMTSSWEEVRGFFGVWQEQELLLAALAVTAAYCCLGISLPSRAIFSIGGRLVRWGAIAVVALIVDFGLLYPRSFMDGIAASPVIGAARFVSGPLSSANREIHGAIVGKRPYGASRTAGDEVHILIIGESSRRDSWSVYGYPRQTTPYMESLKGEAVFLENAVSDANTTVYAVPMLLTGIDPEAFSFEKIRGNLVDLANEAGYLSSWLVNQDAGISYLVGMHADHITHSLTMSSPAFAVIAPDGTLLPEFDRQLARRGSPLFIGLHVYGSHSPYNNRYPDAFKRFGSVDPPSSGSAEGENSDQLIVDSYDDSILYTDWFLQQIIERARKLSEPVTVTYVSDHGEELHSLDGRTGHGHRGYSAGAFEIPAFIWVNTAFRQAHPDKIRALIANSAMEIRSHDFFYSMADLMGIRWPGAIPQRSFASPYFVSDADSRFIAAGKLVARAD
jgi:glucan phosphoethanolaminetransferase (alkaline phosphatase superfamily)